MCKEAFMKNNKNYENPFLDTVYLLLLYFMKKLIIYYKVSSDLTAVTRFIAPFSGYGFPTKDNLKLYFDEGDK